MVCLGETRTIRFCLRRCVLPEDRTFLATVQCDVVDAGFERVLAYGRAISTLCTGHSYNTLHS